MHSDSHAHGLKYTGIAYKWPFTRNSFWFVWHTLVWQIACRMKLWFSWNILWPCFIKRWYEIGYKEATLVQWCWCFPSQAQGHWRWFVSPNPCLFALSLATVFPSPLPSSLHKGKPLNKGKWMQVYCMFPLCQQLESSFGNWATLLCFLCWSSVSPHSHFLKFIIDL